MMSETEEFRKRKDRIMDDWYSGKSYFEETVKALNDLENDIILKRQGNHILTAN